MCPFCFGLCGIFQGVKSWWQIPLKETIQFSNTSDILVVLRLVWWGCDERAIEFRMTEWEELWVLEHGSRVHKRMTVEGERAPARGRRPSFWRGKLARETSPHVCSGKKLERNEHFKLFLCCTGMTLPSHPHYQPQLVWQSLPHATVSRGKVKNWTLLT